MALEYSYQDECITAELRYGFDNEEEAIMALYAELFDSQFELDLKMIYNALRYLTWKKDINHVYDEIVELNEDMIRVEHVCKKEKSNGIYKSNEWK